MLCEKCGTNLVEDANFCISCGSKVRRTCKCWVLKKDNYDCGESSCPGYGLHRVRRIKGLE